MKRTFAINIAGYAFTIDENAYQLLENYLDTISSAFSDNEEGEEITRDIESRVAELLLERISSGSVIVTYEDVKQVISRIGQPEEFTEEKIIIDPNSNETDVETEDTVYGNKEECTTPPPYFSAPPKIKKRLFRDTDDALLGGVCSGLAWYLGIDVTFVRLITVLLIFLSASTVVIAYIILWIVIPPAKTPLQQMQMKGEEPTIVNIGKKVTEKINSTFSNFNKNISARKDNYGINKFLSIVLKIILFSIGLLCIPVIFFIIFIIVVFIIALFGAGGEIITEIFNQFGIESLPSIQSIILWGLLLALGIFLIFLIPIILRLTSTWRNSNNKNSNILRIFYSLLWFCSIALSIVSVVQIVRI